MEHNDVDTDIAIAQVDVATWFKADMQRIREQIELPLIQRTKFRRALALLLEAAIYARETSGDYWEFAVEIGQLHEAGLCENDLRFLVRMRFVEHAAEVTSTGNLGRQFQPTGDLYFANRSCFVLTPRGIATATVVANIARKVPVIRAIGLVRGNLESNTPHVPTWDAARRLLIFNGRIVKQFKWQAVNQETILSVFQEEGWPGRIDDPLAPSPTLDIKRRLSDTIKCLNRKQENKLLHFHGDGSGQGIIWNSIPCHTDLYARAGEIA